MIPGGPPSALDPALADPSASADHDALSKLGSLASSTVSSSAATSGRPPRGGRRKRPSRWDRPPEPHDWRWAVGGIGRVLISVGILMFAFVGYQLYGTGIQTAQAQNRLEDEFADLLATKDTAATEPTTASTAVPETVASTVADQPDEPAVVEPVPSTVPPAAFVPPVQGDPVAQILIPSIDVAKIVIEGVRTSDLEDGPGHFPETPLPGQFGNAAIAGHRTTHGQPFNRIDELQVGDDIVVETLAGTYTYVVTGQVIVSPNDYQLVIPTTDPTIATLTLTSCHPKFSAKQRIVVTAALDPARSDTVTARYIPTVRDPAAPAVIPGDESTDSESDTPGTTIAVDATVPATIDPAVATTDPTSAVTAAADDGTGLDDAASSGQDLFENRWFSDPGAFSQVGLWGLALTLVALAATAISRRARRNLVGLLVGFVPFIVVLYFWFENVNRLLPPNL